MEWEIRTLFWRCEVKYPDNVMFQILNVVWDFRPYLRDQSLSCSSIMILILIWPSWVLLLLIILFPVLDSLQNHRLNCCQGPLTIKYWQTSIAFQCSRGLCIRKRLRYRFWSVLSQTLYCQIEEGKTVLLCQWKHIVFCTDDVH